MRALIIGSYLHILTFTRVKIALFFSFFFPSFIYVIFTMIWGSDSEIYQRFLMTGIIIMTTASDGINSIGTVIKEYYRSGMIKFFKAITYSFSMNVVALLVSRVVIVILSAIPVIILAMMMGQLSFTTGELFFILSGIIVALVIFALIGVIATELLPKAPLSNIIFYAVIFLSNTFYPLTDFKPAFETIVSFNPITPALNLARGDFQFVPVMIWVGVLMIIQVIVYVNSKVKR